MLNGKALIADLRRLHRTVEDDLVARSDSDQTPDIRSSLRTEFTKQLESSRDSAEYETWLNLQVNKVATSWITSCVAIRVLEDNEFIDPPRIAGSGPRLDRARDVQELFFREHPTLTHREYLLQVFNDLSEIPYLGNLFGKRNPLQRLPDWLSDETADSLFLFFQQTDASAQAKNTLVHSFINQDLDASFLSDVHQALISLANHKEVSPKMVEADSKLVFDKTLNAALDRYGLEPSLLRDEQQTLFRMDEGSGLRSPFKILDPACGTGEWLLQAFNRILTRWREEKPDAGSRELVLRTLRSIHGVATCPFAMEIARFRITLAAARACGVCKLTEVPSFHINLSCDADICQQTAFHAVVSDPPYVTPVDAVVSCRVAESDDHPLPQSYEPLQKPLFTIDQEMEARKPSSAEEKIQKPRAASPAPWISALVESPLFDSQLQLVGRAVPPTDMLASLLAAIDQRGGRMTTSAIARALDASPMRIRGMIAVAQRVLNIDGCGVLTKDDASDTVQLDRGLLERQFHLIDQEIARK